MADLTDEQKLEIVEALACFRSPAAIVAHFRSEHGLEIDHKQVGRYDPQRSYYAGGDRWREIFEARRKAFLEDISAIPVAHKAYRLNELHDLYERAKRAGNYVLAAQLLEQSAKEVGGALTNERNLRVDEHRHQRARDMSPEDRRSAFAELVRQAIEQGPRKVLAAIN